MRWFFSATEAHLAGQIESGFPVAFDTEPEDWPSAASWFRLCQGLPGAEPKIVCVPDQDVLCAACGAFLPPPDYDYCPECEA